MAVVKRFIAGATCPRCAAQDTLRMYRDEEREYRECVECDFSDSMRLDGVEETSPEELETRVNRDPEPLAEDVAPLKFVANPESKRKDH
ncbi:MAG: YheV family putative zinc ribbon protein [Pontibacterium sp.]